MDERTQKWVNASEAPKVPIALYKLLQDAEPTAQVPFDLKMNNEEEAQVM
jgi:hypothetical protein